MTEKLKPKDMHCYIKALLGCSATIQLMKKDKQAGIWNLIVTPPDGQKIEWVANTRDNELSVLISDESLVGLYQLLRMLVQPPKKKFLGLF